MGYDDNYKDRNSPYATQISPPLKIWGLMKPQTENIESIIREALNRHEAGRLEKGDLDLDTDKRDFIFEAEKELLDCIKYCVFQILRLRRLRTEN